MLTVAYLANEFPAAVEPYVMNEIVELRSRGVRMIGSSVWKPRLTASLRADLSSGLDYVCLAPVRSLTLLQAFLLLVRRRERITGLLTRILLRGKESPSRRFKALIHTVLGAYYASILLDRNVSHIHVHHGYFGSWVGMSAARLLGVNFSMTLYGSDLLLHRAYMDEKLRQCRLCFTISEYNRQFLLQNFPEIDPRKVIVSRLGVEVPEKEAQRAFSASTKLTLFTVGRLHIVKNHRFLILACARLRDLGIDFECFIAGEGPERRRLQSLIRTHHLQGRVTLLGYISQDEMNSFYTRTDLFVLTSVSEGIPVVLMEAMARELVVLAPTITGIPELVSHGESGFLYEPGNLNDFTEKILDFRRIVKRYQSAEPQQRIGMAGRTKVLSDFNRQKNLHRFADLFLQSISPQPRSFHNENSVVQQVQLSL